MKLDSDSNLKLYQQVFEFIQNAIENELFMPGTKLPPLRSLATELGCSRNTIEKAYEMLAQEGYVKSRPGSGFVVQDTKLLHADAHPAYEEKKIDDERPGHDFYDFTYGNLQKGTFPASAWRTITNDLLGKSDCYAADTYTNPLGEMELRVEIARQLNSSRDITCSPDQIVIQSGTESSIQNLLALFDRKSDTILMEEPGYNGIRDAFIRSGFKLNTVAVDKGTNALLDGIESSGAKLLFLTPSSQFPTCKAMPLNARNSIINWAKRTEAYILEDDYCREFRYLKRPAAPLASLDAERVIYMSTFSKALSPALRLNYLVLPDELLDKWQATYSHTYSTVPWLSQAVLARFMRSGQWDKHLRRLQAINRRKYEKLISAIRSHMGQRVAIRENGTGLHLLVDVLDGRPQDELIEVAARKGVHVYPTRCYCMHEQPSMRSCVLIGFSAIDEADIEPGIKALADAWFEGKNKTLHLD